MFWRVDLKALYTIEVPSLPKHCPPQGLVVNLQKFPNMELAAPDLVALVVELDHVSQLEVVA